MDGLDETHWCCVGKYGIIKSVLVAHSIIISKENFIKIVASGVER